MMSGSHLSKDFFDFVKAIGEAKSKQQEDTIIVDEIATLKRRMIEKDVSKKKMKEFLIRLVYVEMLGHDASFGYIKAIELAASKNLVQKRVGYLCSSLCLSPSHEFRFMLVNQLQHDLASANYLEVGAALSAIVRLATADMIPARGLGDQALLDHVVKVMQHPREFVRKKVVMVLHRFFQLDASAVEHLNDKMRRTLCDKDPSVMASSLCLLHAMCAAKPGSLKELVPSFVSILKQIVEHRLPRDFDYHRIPAPWTQLRLLRLLAHLGRADQVVSEGMYAVLADVMRRADTGINVGYAIVYECVRTITSIYPNATLLDEAAKSISRFVASDNHNLKYLGITGLAQVVEGHPKYAARHQLAVIECLEDVDDTLKRKTLDLLYRMINPVNVEFIASKLLQSLETSTDEFLRAALVSRLCTAAERFAPSNEWYVLTVIRVLDLAGELVQPDVSQNLVSLIAEGDEGDEDAVTLRRTAVDTFAQMLDSEMIPDSLLPILAWVLGEYGSLSAEDPRAAAPRALEDLALDVAELCADDARLRNSPASRRTLLTAVLKLTSRLKQVRGDVPLALAEMGAQLCDRFAHSADLELQQRALEFSSLVELAATGTHNDDLLPDILPHDASLEDPLDGASDDALSFLDRFVASALAAGAAPYAPPDDDDDDAHAGDDAHATKDSGALKFEAYAKPAPPPMMQRDYRNNDGSAPAAATETIKGAAAPQTPGGGSTMTMMDTSAARKNAIGGRLGAAGLATTAGPWGKPSAMHEVVASYHAEPAAPAAGGSSKNGDSYYACGGAPPSPSYHREASDEAPAELSDKERMAAQLFGGLGAATAPARAARTAKPARAPHPLSKKEGALPPAHSLPPPAATAGNDDDDDDTTATPAASKAPPPDDVDLLGGFDDDAPAAAPPVPAAAATATATTETEAPFAGTSNDDLLGFSAPILQPPVASHLAVVGPNPLMAAAAVDPFASLSESPASPLAPARLTTADFGARWGGNKHERKRDVPTMVRPDLRTLAGVSTALTTKAGLHAIEAIAQTNELILAAVHTPSGASVLWHVKVLPSKLAVTVRAPQAHVADLAMEITLQALG